MRERSKSVLETGISHAHSVLHGKHVDWTTGLLSLLDLLHAGFACETHPFLKDGSLFGREIDGEVWHAHAGGGVGGIGGGGELW